MADIKPYTISIPQEKIDLTKKKLELASFPNELDNSGWELGVPLSEIQRLVKYWKNGYDWRAAESKLNQLPHFTTQIEVDGFGLWNTHFIYAKCKVPGVKAIPLMFVHGWPGNFLEVEKLLPLLTESEEGPYFDVVAPSLADFGFSDHATKIGFNTTKHAELYHKLMLKLGYDEYVTQGGDWGSTITKFMALQYGPKHCKSVHFNLMWWVQPPKFTQNPLLWLQYNLQPFSKLDKERLERKKWFDQEGFGYNLLQGTKPQTVGYGLQDSPVGLLAWVYEKLHDWSDNYPWTDDEILTWVSLYAYSNGGPTASGRIYYMDKHRSEDLIKKTFGPIQRSVAVGFSLFPMDISVWPLAWARSEGNVVFERLHKNGGHFAAHERPEWLAQDLKDMYGKGKPVYGVVSGRNGYAGGSKL